jgi:hypothetical protein
MSPFPWLPDSVPVHGCGKVHFIIIVPYFIRAVLGPHIYERRAGNKTNEKCNPHRAATVRAALTGIP